MLFSNISEIKNNRSLLNPIQSYFRSYFFKIRDRSYFVNRSLLFFLKKQIAHINPILVEQIILYIMHIFKQIWFMRIEPWISFLHSFNVSTLYLLGNIL